MRERDRDASKCLSPSQVKQTLARLDKDGETSRNAMTSLKQCVENMDEATIPRFVTQVSDAREKSTSRAYAISLYEDVARVHGKLIVPQLHRVMSTVVRSLSSSGSSPQLQEACAKVLATIAKHAIDESSPARASEVLRDLCHPLLDVLAGKLEPLAAGAAVCLLALVECEKWKFASDEVVAETCLKTAVALGEKGTRSVAHMHLARALAMTDSPQFCSYGVSILRSAAEVLKSSAVSGSWQQRAGAARLVTAVLPTVDRATIGEELAPVIRALDGCKHDRMSNVRWSVKEAMKAAKLIFEEENARRANDGDEPLSWADCSESTTSSVALRRTSSSGYASSDEAMSPVSSRMSRSRRGSSPVPPPIPVSPTRSYRGSTPASSITSLTSSAPPDSPVPRARAPAVLPPAGLQQRAPLQATRQHIQVGSFDASSVTSSNDIDSPRKENLPSQERDSKTGSTLEVESSPSGVAGSGRVGTYVRPRPSTPRGTFIPYPPSSPREGVPQHSMDPERNDLVMSNGLEGKVLFPPNGVVVRANSDQRGRESVTEVEVFPSLSSSNSLNGSKVECSRLTSVSGEGELYDIMTAREAENSTSPNSGASRRQGVLDASTMKHVFELKRPVAGNSMRNVKTPREGDEDNTACTISSPLNDDWKEPPNRILSSPMKAHSPTPPRRSVDDNFRLTKTTSHSSLSATEDFFQFTTPRRLVRSLQGSFSGSLDFPGSRFLDQDLLKLRGDEARGDATTTDMDLGTPTSSTGWSVRTNPIASDESLKTESDDSDREEGRPIWKKMVSDSSPTPPAAPHTPPVQETVDNPDNSDGFRHRLNHPGDSLRMGDDAVAQDAGVEEKVSQEERERQHAENNLFDQGEIIKRTQQDAVQGTVSVKPEDSQKECIDKWSCNEISSRTCEAGEGSSSGAVEVSERGPSHHSEDSARRGNAPSRIEKFPLVDQQTNLGDNVKRFLGWSYNKGRDHVIRNWHVCLVVVTIPFAVMVLSNVLLSRETSGPRYLVPT